MIYAGDSNQDGVVDLEDMNETEAGSTVMLLGYHAPDLNGDGVVDLTDMNIAEINAAAMVMIVLPQ